MARDPSTAWGATSSATDECRRLAELLNLDAVGVATFPSEKRRVAWWTAPGSPPLPAKLDDILLGRVEDWVVYTLPDRSSVFARLNARSSVRSADVLRSLGPSLVAALMGESDPVPAPPAPELLNLATHEDPRIGTLTPLLSALCESLGFDNASLFAPAAGGAWELLDRGGPARPWDTVIDPAYLLTSPDGAVYPDVRALPGVGSRLAVLGCRSLAVLPLPDGGRVILSSGRVGPPTDWMERIRPLLSLISALPTTPGLRALPRPEEELGMVRRVVESGRLVLETPAQGMAELLHAVREVLHADEVFHLMERAGDVDVVSSPAGEWPLRIPKEIRSKLRGLHASEAVDEGTARQLGVVLGARSRALAMAFSRDAEPPEIVVAGWSSQPVPSPGAMRLIAHVIGACQAALHSRRRAVNTLVLRERTRWAYEIHDGLTQTVTAAVLELEGLGKRIERDPKDALAALARSKAEIRTALSHLRGLLYDLSEEQPDHAPDEPLSRYVNDIVRRWRLPARIRIDGELHLIPRRLLGVTYVVIREALANAAKHAAARNVEINVSASAGEMVVDIQDDGRGFDSRTEGERRRHFGLDMIRSRVAEAGGTLEIESSVGRGTRVVARLPVQTEGDAR